MNEMENVKTWECGLYNASNVIATLKGTTLIISGKGKMAYKKEYQVLRPWYREKIVHAIIEKGVENIGESTFMSCLGLKSVEIADSITSIDNYAFCQCSALEHIFLPNSVDRIGIRAFDGCKSLSSINISNNIKVIESAAFINCDVLNVITNRSLVPQIINKEVYDDWHYKYVDLHVPSSALNAYKNAPFWALFKNILPIGDAKEEILQEQIDEEIEILEREKTEIEGKLEILHFKKTLMRGLKGKPKHVAEFMSLFNQRDGLKYLTHDIDGNEEFNCEEVVSLVRKVCTDNFEDKEIPQSLRDLLNQFIFERNPKWKSFDKDYNEIEILSGWSADDWEEAKNGNFHPIRLPKYAEIIRTFKRLTRVESPYLETLVNKVFADNDLEIETKYLSKADFYTHVGEFKIALETIFAEIQKRSVSVEKKKVSVTYKREPSDDFFVRKIIITHHNSFPTRDGKDTLIKEWLSFEKGCMAKIAEHLLGYCYWSVETCIDDEPVRVNILRENETEPYEAINSSTVDGFTHILTFYYQS